MFSPMLLHERLLLLALDDVKGTSRVSFAEQALAGAVLFSLLRDGAVELVDGRVKASGGSPNDVALRGAAALVAAEPKQRDVRWWVDNLPRLMAPFVPRLARRLVESGVLSQEQHKILGIFPTTRLPERVHAPEAEVAERLRAVLLGQADATMEDAELAALVSALDLVGTIVDKPDRDRAEQRARELLQSADVGDAVTKSIKAAQDAVLAAVVASTVAATVAGTAAT